MERVHVELRVTAGPHEGHCFTFDGHDSFIVGRSPWAHFRMSNTDRYFSRIHFMIEVNPPRCRLFDMGSTNGTLVNGQCVSMIDLRDGDLIKGGRTVLQVSLVGRGEEESEESPGERTVTLVSPAAQPEVPASSPADPVTTEDHLPRIEGYRLMSKLGQGGHGGCLPGDADW
jgi:pSer/pThr/pTyr-binding forkhead associated (FHA) protein